MTADDFKVFAMGYLFASAVFWASAGYIMLQHDLDTEPLEKLSQGLLLVGLALLIVALVLKISGAD